ncbi:MAG: flagellar hook-associated protein FlgL [Nitrospirae bacterium]|nr:flagellar hook-associated protein FlgL [Nitrospirota bacterium]
MRITSFAIFNQMTRSLQERLRDLSVYSDRLSSGKKINKPSDDVFGMMKSMDYKVTINEIDQYRKNIDEADSQLSLTDNIMDSVATALTRSRELAVQTSTGTQSAEDRQAAAAEIENLRNEISRLAGTKFRDIYIFSGYKTDTAPFDAGYNYQGDSSSMDVLIDRNSTVAMNVTGDVAFRYGGVSFMKTLDDLYTALMNNKLKKANPADPLESPGIQESITSLDNAIGQVANVRADVGARMSYLEGLKSTHEDRDLTMKTLLSNTEDTDIAETVSEITKIQVALESLRVSGAKVISQSLLDFLQ